MNLQSGAKVSPAKSKPTKANSVRSMMVDREHQSVSVRKISNGFVISKSCDGPKGYTCTEEFSPTKPKIEMQISTPKKR